MLVLLKGGIYNITVEIPSDGMIFLQSVIKIGSGILKGGIHIQKHRHRQEDDRVSLLSFFQNNESRLK
jgi:hypothetical protein